MAYYDDEDRELDQIDALLENTDAHCYSCRHFKGGMTCEAFPDQIPSPILTGQVRHTKKLFDQDNNIVFEPKEE